MRVKIFTLSLLLLLSSVATGYAQDATNGNCGENLTWVFSEEDGTLTISGTGAMDDWESVTDRPWASLLNDITAIMVENGVTTIGESAFFECVNLTDVITPLSVTSIGDFAFYGCSKLTSVKLGNGVKSVGMTAFSGCTGLTEIVIPDNVEKIAVAAFGQCTGLTSVTIGKSVVTIEYGGFSGCSNLTTITNLNPTPQNIGGYLNVFGKMESTPGPDLSRVTLYVVSEEAKTAYEAAPVWKDFKEVLCLPAYNGECGENLTWTFSEGTLTISGTGAMDDWDDPKEEAPEALPWLAYLEDITKVVIEEGVTSIGASAFGMCVNLTDVTIPASVTEIGFAAFGSCSSLEEITIPNTVDYIGGNAFALCASLTEITIPENVTSIEDGTFVWSGLTAITIPDKVTSIGMFAFGSCADLASVTLGESVEYLGYGAFAECAGLEAITIPDKVEVIDKGAFMLCEKLASVNIGNSVDSIVANAFLMCTSLEEIIIPDNVKSIGEAAFGACLSLTSVTIGSGVEDIQMTAFAGCPALQTVTNLNPTPQEIGANVFADLEGEIPGADLSQATLYVASEEAKAAYEAADVWEEFGRILCVPASIDTRFAENGFHIYPNPVVESFRIEGITAPASVVITNASGQTVMRQIVNGSENVSVGHLPQGIYFVRANGSAVKFIKR